MRIKRSKQPSRQRANSGSSSPEKFSYYSNRSVSDQSGDSRNPGRAESQSRKSMLTTFAGRFGAIIAFAAVILLLVSSIQVDMKPRVVILNQDQSLQLHTASEYQTTAEQVMKKSWTNTNKLTIDTRSVGIQMQLAHPEIADVSVALPLVGQRLVMFLQLTEPQLILSGKDGLAYVIDENGRALVDVANAGTNVVHGLPTISDESSLAMDVGKVALPQEDVAFIKTVLYQLNQSGIPLGRISLPSGGRELDIYVSGQPYFIKFNLEENTPKQQVGSFLAVDKHLQKKGEKPKEYIDVRLAGRAYYR